jgi:hypothetical protein
VKGFVALGLLSLACGGGAASAPAQAPERAADQVDGCWRDAGDGTVLCLEERGYVLFLPDGKWDRVAVDWAEVKPTQRSGRTRTPRPLWLSVRIEGPALVMDDGQTQTRLARPPAKDNEELEARVLRLPQLSEACARARACREHSSMPGSELDSPRACIAYLNAVASVIRKTGALVPAPCVP